MTLDFSLITAAILAAASIMIIILAAQFWLSKKYLKLKQDYEELTELVHGLNNALRDSFTTSTLMDGRLAALEVYAHDLHQQMEGVLKKMDGFRQETVPSHPYSQAIQKVQSGASISELMQSSGLSQDEAALLIRLHGAKVNQ